MTAMVRQRDPRSLMRRPRALKDHLYLSRQQQFSRQKRRSDRRNMLRENRAAIPTTGDWTGLSAWVCQHFLLSSEPVLLVLAGFATTAFMRLMVSIWLDHGRSLGAVD